MDAAALYSEKSGLLYFFKKAGYIYIYIYTYTYIYIGSTPTWLVDTAALYSENRGFYFFFKK